MSPVKFFLFVLCSICLIIFNSKAFSQEIIEKAITDKEASQIILLFPPTEETNKLIPKYSAYFGTGREERLEEIDLRSFVNAFEGFKVEQIEVWVSMVVQTKGVIGLFISAKGEGGIKVLLKPK